MFKGKHKVSANEFAKLFIMDAVDSIISNMDIVFNENHELYSKFTDKEKNDIKEQMTKRADGIRGYYKINEIIPEQ